MLSACPGCGSQLIDMTNPDPWNGTAPQYPHYPQYGQYPQADPAYGYGYAHYPPPAPAKPSKGRRIAMGIGAGVAAAALVTAGAGIGAALSSHDSTTVAQSPSSLFGGSAAGSGGSGGSGAGNGGAAGQFPQLFPGGQGGGTAGGGTGGTGTPGTAATSTQQKGIVTINSVLQYQNAESAGTGMILTADGEVLTNNHVIDGATSVTVTDESTGRTYRADVVGTDPGDDVAVLQLQNASGLTTAKVGGTSGVAVGDKVTGVGNAGGTGSLTQVSGKVTALDKAITATDESGSSAENLTGLIETDAAIVSGDSGGPLYDADGTVIGIDTAASSANGTGAASQAYAIPIERALGIAKQIESGTETSSVHIGLPAFIGVGAADEGGNGVGITSVLGGGPADNAGITAGSTITAIGGTRVSDAQSLLRALGQYKPGQQVKITWTDPEGQSHTASVTTVSGPAD